MSMDATARQQFNASPPGTSSRLSRLLQMTDRQEGLRRGWQIIIFGLVLLVLFSRDPSLFTHSQFFAEDGVVWYAQAYNSGWLHSLTLPSAGYLSTVQRLGAGFAMLVPFRWAPLPMMLWGLLVQALPVSILLSSRCGQWAALSTRIAFAAVYVAIPNAQEIHVVCTNSQWHLALAALLLAFAAPPRTAWQRIFDVIVLALCSLSGPFGILLVPFVAVFWWIRRQRWSLVVLAILATTSLLQLCMLHLHSAERTVSHQGGQPHLGATPALFIRMLGGDVFAGALLGSGGYGVKFPFVLDLMAFIIGLLICAYFFRFASAEGRFFMVYCFALFLAGLWSPLAPPVNGSLWQGIVGRPSLRYWFFPSLPFLLAVVWCAKRARSRVIRSISVGLALVLCVGIVHDWRVRPLFNPEFDAAARSFAEAPRGTHRTIPITPRGWTMDLVKK